MWRAFFLAFGVTLIVLGIECFLVDEVEIERLRTNRPQATNPFMSATSRPASFITQQVQPNSLSYEPKDWMPWSLMAVGTVVLIYTYSLPKRSES